MKQRCKLVAVALLLVTSSVGLGSFDQTASANSIENRISDVKQERNQKQQEAQKTKEEIEKLEKEMNQLNEEIREIDHKVATTNQNIREKRAEIKKVREHIETLQEEIVVLEKRIAERDALLKDRARSMYQSGGSVNYLEVVLGSKSFGDFLERVSALSVIAQQDRNIIEAHFADQEKLEETKAKVESELASLEVQQAELESLMADLEEQRAQKDDLMSRLESKENDLHADLGELENAEEILRSQEAALKEELAAYEERQRQEAAAAAEAERQAAERQRQAAEAERQAQNQPSSRNGGGSAQVHSAPAVTNSGFMRPATGSITSTYGQRWGRMHHGIDIGKNGRSGDVPIVAVQDGTVVEARYMNGYGNTVIIAHYVDGQLITTLSAHMENLGVSKGQRVSKGQTIGLMGNTGRSFGAHLHFEVHEGGWNGAKSNSVDPLRYIPR
ncbi:murein hydrolase activator EnvC family protein [Halalkalibacter nanhaiisediminis]|uniref:Peptidoglycan hydrolase CwlO-like protein n=1 Tax=Halalkalibacter nanhaiisediminis TaxID=688079 RepID=A0A562QTN7_9BACI|nr:peptidoglycan DD-metalloendopeptidase family protein [Halalkalibacter nanhaiisediminis]TWI59973.1 peptidoglycan hydrolase CwlO-like protein [Halalkalibacter nanhaiisediminis]